MKKPSPCAGQMIAALLRGPRTTGELEDAVQASPWTIRGYIQMFKATGVIRVARKHSATSDEVLELAFDDPNESLA